MADWNVIDELGGEAAATAVVQDLYDRMFDDIIIGFLFAKSDKAALVKSQLAWVSANLGDRTGVYDGPSIRASHASLPITSGMFDRRHQILEEVLAAHDAPEHVATAWLRLDLALRDNVVRWGTDVRGDE